MRDMADSQSREVAGPGTQSPRSGARSSAPQEAAPRRVTIAATPRIKRIQRLHAAAILVVPTLGSLAALAMLLVMKVSAWHLVIAAVLYALTILGITVGFHRLLSHRSFKAGPVTFATFVILGSMAAQGPPLYWACNHRRHHQFTERAGDPHSPHDRDGVALSGWRGFLHAHIGWSFSAEMTNSALYGKDLLRNRLLGRLNQLYYLWVALGVLAPALLGVLIERSAWGFLQGFVWGGCVRLALSYHSINAINSVTHLYGTRPFATREQSRNNAWLALPTFGESWHNNHHAYPGSAVFGFRWWQVDLGAWTILALERCGLVTAVARPHVASGPAVPQRPGSLNDGSEAP